MPVTKPVRRRKATTSKPGPKRRRRSKKADMDFSQPEVLHLTIDRLIKHFIDKSDQDGVMLASALGKHIYSRSEQILTAGTVGKDTSGPVQ